MRYCIILTDEDSLRYCCGSSYRGSWSHDIEYASEYVQRKTAQALARKFYRNGLCSNGAKLYVAEIKKTVWGMEPVEDPTVKKNGQSTKDY